MCQPAPKPRCSASTKRKVDTTVQSYIKSCETNNRSAKKEAFKAYCSAKTENDATYAGLRDLENKINRLHADPDASKREKEVLRERLTAASHRNGERKNAEVGSTISQLALPSSIVRKSFAEELKNDAIKASLPAEVKKPTGEENSAQQVIQNLLFKKSKPQEALKTQSSPDEAVFEKIKGCIFEIGVADERPWKEKAEQRLVEINGLSDGDQKKYGKQLREEVASRAFTDKTKQEKEAKRIATMREANAYHTLSVSNARATAAIRKDEKNSHRKEYNPIDKFTDKNFSTDHGLNIKKPSINESTWVGNPPREIPYDSYRHLLTREEREARDDNHGGT